MDPHAAVEGHPEIHRCLIILSLQDRIGLLVIQGEDPQRRAHVLAGISGHDLRVYQKLSILIKPHTLICIIDLHVSISDAVGCSGHSHFQPQRLSHHGFTLQ